jgi:L-alanine-DL-glutamate epimerase-like enolase superfamily enzyme
VGADVSGLSTLRQEGLAHTGRRVFDTHWLLLNSFNREVRFFVQAISAVDLAIWDCLGKHLKEPIYNLIGGKVRTEVLE